MRFENQVALITGGGTGIGRATALAFAENGARVVIANRRTETGQAVVKEIQSQGGQAFFQQTDVTQPDSVKALIERIEKEYGQLDFAFNNAGYGGQPGPLHEHDLADAEKQVNINILGVIYSMKYEIEAMLKRGKGVVVNNSSMLGVKATANMSIYVATKHAVNGLTKSAALDYAAQGIRVNGIAPGPIETDMLRDLGGGSTDPFAEMNPTGRVGRPEEIAAGVMWLCSDEAPFTRGHILTIDGGACL